jgi:hypothetical protein
VNTSTSTSVKARYIEPHRIIQVKATVGGPGAPTVVLYHGDDLVRAVTIAQENAAAWNNVWLRRLYTGTVTSWRFGQRV